MSLAITHFALGASVGLLITSAAGAYQYDGLAILTGGGWAMVPDLSKFVQHDAILSLHDSAVANLFLFHELLDVYDPSDSIVVGLVALVFFALVVLVTTLGRFI